MRSQIIVVLSVLLSFVPPVMGFNESDMDVLYGIGMGKTLEEADRQAFLSLSKTLNAVVTTDFTHDIIEQNGEYDESWKRRDKIQSYLSKINAVRQSCSIDENGIYKVYRYVVKSEYIKSKLEDYNFHIKKSTELSRSDSEPYNRNLALGHCYDAHELLKNDPLFKLLYGTDQTNDIIKAAMDSARYIYGQIPHVYGYSSSWGDRVHEYHQKYGEGVILTSDESRNCKKCYLYDLEYRNVNDKGSEWIVPCVYYKTTSSGRMESYGPHMSCVAYLGKEHKVFGNQYGTWKYYYIGYRPLYERIVNGHNVRINVPEGWYFEERTTTVELLVDNKN